jgi:hypothetical protein
MDNAEITASVASWAIFGAGLRWSRGGEPGTVEEFADQALSAIVGGFDPRTFSAPCPPGRANGALSELQG